MGAHPVPRFAVLAALALASCGPGPDPRDAGDGGGADAMPGGARAIVRLPREPLDGGGLTVRRFVVSIGELRLVSDRGEPFDPVRTDVGELDIATPQTLALEAIPPASYSAVLLRLAGGLHTVELEIEDSELGLVHVVHDEGVDWMARCSSGVPVGVGEQLEIGITLELDGAWEELREASLPPPVGGVIELDETTAPGVVHDLIEAIGAGLRAECGEADS
jgi:hypothetical protein